MPRAFAKTTLLSVLGLGACLLVPAAVQAGAPLVANGSFEEGTDADPADWTRTGNVARSDAAGATDGAFSVVWNGGDLAPDGSIEQTVTTTPGVVYQLAFDFGAVAAAGTEVQRLRVEVLGAATLLDRIVERPAAPAPSFERFVFQFLADGGSADLVFSDASAETIGVDGVLDDVTLTEAAETVESVAWARTGPPAVVGVPGDDAIGSVPEITLSDFSDRRFHAGLEAALLAAGVVPADLEAADFIAFELNGTLAGFEGATWTFDDGEGGTFSTTHAFGTTSTGMLFNGDLLPANYEALFDTEMPPTAPFSAVVLFDLASQGVNAFAPGLSVVLEGLDDVSGVNEPDPSGMGAFRHPEEVPTDGFCGDGMLDPEEQCDDGNTIPGDGCDALCQEEDEGGEGFCGDGMLDPEEQCDDGNTIPGDGCDTLCQEEDDGGGEICAAAPLAGCLSADKAKVAISEKKAGKEKLKAQLKGFGGATGQSDLGDPLTGSARYDLCLYDGANQLAAELSVDRAGQSCGPKQKPCFKDKGGNGWLYKDPAAEADGAKKLSLASGPVGKGKALWQAGNNAKKGQTSLPTGIAGALDGATAATVQLVVAGGTCFEATLGNVKKADATSFSAKKP